jgi:hypothetical protein
MAQKVINYYTNQSHLVTVEENNQNMRVYVGEIVGLYKLGICFNLPLDTVHHIGAFFSLNKNNPSRFQQRELNHSYNKALFAEILRNSVGYISRSNDENDQEENGDDFDECLWVVTKTVKYPSNGNPYLMEARNCFVCGGYDHFFSALQMPYMTYRVLRDKIGCNCI